MDISNLATKDDLRNVFNKVDQRMNSFANRMDNVDQHIDNLETRMDQFEQTQQKMLQVLDRLERHALANEYYWKAYTDVDTIHEERMSKHEKRTTLIKKHLKLKPPAELLPSV